MGINLACQHFKFHNLLFVSKLRLIDAGLIHFRILLFNIPYHDLKIRKGLRDLILSLDIAADVIILRTGLMHGLSQSEHTGGEIFGKKMNDQSRNQNSHGKYEHTDSQNPFNADIA